MRRLSILTAATAGIIAATAAPAQNVATETEYAEAPRDDDDAPWGLLGLLGLAGLLPKKREPAIHVDARHTKP